MPLPVAERWYVVRDVGDGVTLVTEPHVHPLLQANAFHVRGDDADLLIDGGCGLAPLRPFLRELGLDAPGRRLAAVATHAHFDHVGALHEADEVLAHAAEAASVAAGGQPGLLLGAAWAGPVADAMAAEGYPLPEVLLDALPAAGFDAGAFASPAARVDRLLDEGDEVEVGGRRLAVLHTPGHSPGGIALLEEATGILFAGDVVYDGELLDDLPGADRAVYVETALRLRELAGVRVVLAGHGEPFDAASLRRICDLYVASRTRPDAGDRVV